MYLRRDLAWVRGFPIRRGQWLALPDGDEQIEVALDRKLIRKSTRTINLLRREFPRALPRIVGNTTRWAEAHRALLDVLKATVHGGALLPQDPLAGHPHVTTGLDRSTCSLLARRPKLRRIVIAMQWYGYCEIESHARALRWCDRQHAMLELLIERLGNDAQALAIRLWQLECAFGRRLEKVYAVLRHPLVWSEPFEVGGQLYNDVTERVATNASPAPPRPTPQLSTVVIEWLAWLAQQDRACRRRGLQIFDLLVNVDHASHWADWWQGVYEIHEQGMRNSRRTPHEAITRREAGQLRKRLNHLRQNVPPVMPAAVLRTLLTTLPQEPNAPLCRALLRALAQFPATAGGGLTRPALARHWLELWSRAPGLHRRTGRLVRKDRLLYLRRLTAFLRERGFSTPALTPWLPVLSSLQPGRGPYNQDAELLDELDTPRKIESFFDIVSAQEVWDSDKLELLAHLVTTLDAAQARMALDNWGNLGQHDFFDDSAMRLACELTRDTPDRFASVLTALNESHGRYWDIEDVLRDCIAAFDDARLGQTLLDAVVTGHMKTVRTCALKLNFIGKQRRRAPPVWRRSGRRPHWPHRYPQPLRAALARLCDCDRDAERTAMRVLGRDFPDAGALRREISRLQDIAQLSFSQQKRLGSLSERLSTPPVVSHKRLDNLKRKLETAAVRRSVEQWRDDIDEHFDSALLGYLKCTALPDWCEREQTAELIAPIATLPASSRRLAREILIARCAAQPWDFRDLPANRKFLRKCARAGLDLSPWIEGEFSQNAVGPESKPLRLAIERDPLEILHMGAHFDTCLSPGEFNFFSVFSNIADINKQVVYARDQHGRVFGRVLLALTNQCALLSFYPYAHSRDTGFDRAAAQFAHDLAQRMGTRVVSSGEVEKLVADRWYDDGPVDIAQQHPELAEGSTLRESIASVAPQRFLASLVEALGLEGLDALTLPLVIELPELDERPELMQRLLAPAARVWLPMNTLLRLATFGLPSASESERRQLVARIYRETDANRRNPNRYLQLDAIGVLAQYAPHLALRLLRRTRPEGVRRWSDEYSGDRLACAAAAHEALHRPKKAADLYRLALSTGGHRSLMVHWRKALRRLQ